MDHDLEQRTRVLLKLLQNLGLVNPDSDLQQRDRDRDSIRGVRSASHSSSSEELLHQPGEIPAVQDRFHALLKRRLLIEAQQKPPVFPWEKEAVDYDAESSPEVQPVLAAG
jgi:hypothetical protein